MKSSVLRQDPIFVLKGINPKTLQKNYFEGKYVDLQVPESRINISNVFYLNTPTFGCSPEDSRYQFKGQNNVSMVILTTNTRDYAFYKEKKLYECKLRRCPWCITDYESEPIRVPVQMETFKLKNGKTQLIFWDTGICCCSFGCAIAWAKRESILSPCYQRSPHLLSVLFQTMYPKQQLIETPPFNILDVHGGPLTKEDYTKYIYKYERTNNLVFLPAKEEYLQQSVA